MLEHRRLAHDVELAVAGGPRLAAEIVDEARRPVGAGKLRATAQACSNCPIAQNSAACTRPAAWPSHQPPVASQRSTCSNRSTPQNGSPSTMTKGEPKTPAAIALSFSSLSASLIAGSSIAARAAAASTPDRPRSRRRGRDSRCRRRRQKRRDKAHAARRPSARDCVRCSQRTMRAGACVGIGNTVGIRKAVTP